MSTPTTTETHLIHLRHALALASQSVPTPTAYCVGAVLVSPTGVVLSSGFSRELPGNTHAEQCALEKLGMPPPEGSTMYTTMEPCSERLSGNVPCLQRILDVGGVKTVVVAVREPEKFVKDNVCERVLKERGVEYVYVPGLEKECLEVAQRGH